jgi:predicted ATP-grasp superfamily ATP-dependent carboligase
MMCMSNLRVFVYEYLSGGGAAADLTADDIGLLEQGRAMRDAIVADLARVDGVHVTYAAVDDPGVVPARHVVAAAPGPRESPTQFLRRQLAEHDCVWVVAPETDGILAGLRDCVDDDRWIGCSAEAIRVAGSKRATRERLQASAIATTRDAAACDAALSPGLRVVVKPDDGAGACETRVHATLARALDDCSRREACGRKSVAELWEEGAPLSLSLLCGPAGHVEVLSVNRQSIDVTTDGCVRYGGVVVDVRNYDASAGAFAALARSVVHALPGLRGYVGMDFVLRGDGRPVVVEINPRVTCAYVGLSAALGRNVAGEVLRQRERIFEHAQP